MNRVLLIPMLLCAAVTHGQNLRGGPPPMIPGDGANFSMICLHPVAVRELKLDGEQVKAIRKIVTEINREPTFYPNRNDALDVERERFLLQQTERRQQIADADKQTAKLLSPEQRKRAKQLLFQYNLQIRRVEAALRSIDHKLDDERYEHLEAMLSTIPVVVAAKSAELNYQLVANVVDEKTPDTPSRQLMGEMFRFVHKDDDVVDMDRHAIEPDSIKTLPRQPRRQN